MADEKKAKKAANEKAGKDDKKKSKKNPFKAIGSFFKSVRSEGKKVVWPKAAEVWKNTLVVIVVIAIVGIVIYAIDFGLTTGMKALKNAATTTAVAEDAEAEEDDIELVDETEAESEAETEAASEAEAEAVTEAETEAAD